MQTIVKRYTMYIDIESYISTSVVADESGQSEESLQNMLSELNINSLAVFQDNNFTILDFNKSNRQNSKSVYISGVRSSGYKSKNYKCILFIRISDHSMNPDTEAARNEYYERKAQTFKQPESKSHQKWKLKSIVMDGTHCSTVDEALDELDKRLKTF